MQENFIVAIHERAGSFSDRWIEYCQQQTIPYRVVNAFSTSLVQDLRSSQVLLWHWNLGNFAATLAAKQIIRSLEYTGIQIFPNTNTCWHYDDKIAQKYLLEAIDVPFAPTWVFYNLEDSLKWVEQADFPKVFKLRRGAASSNVKLVQTRSDARSICKQAFSRGFNSTPYYFTDATTKIRKTHSVSSFIAKVKRLPTTLLKIYQMKAQYPREKGYVYFQEFMPSNDHDTRVVIIGEKAFTMIRKNRPNDFRASGSGNVIYDPEVIDLQLLALSYEIASKLGTQSIAIDYVYDANRKPVVLEISYCFVTKLWPGYWDKSFHWHPGDVWVQDVILENVLSKLGYAN